MTHDVPMLRRRAAGREFWPGPARVPGRTGRGLLLLLLLGCSAPVPFSERAPHVPALENRSAELVVLVHGLGRSRLSMLPMELALKREGFEVLNWGYGSTSASVAELGSALSARIDTATRDAPNRRVHLVGHSLGNILIRWMLVHHPPRVPGRVVMLAPPNQGARAADRYAPTIGWLLKPLPELTTAATSTARLLPTPPGVEIGIIAGDRDHKVSVAETHLPGEAAHVVVPAYHTFIMAQPRVQRLTARFLRSGTFGGTSASGGSPLVEKARTNSQARRPTSARASGRAGTELWR